MAVYLLIALVALTAVAAKPAPGRVPRVYNALITSNQNLEPSKAYPVYQPVFHDAFAYPYQPVFYGGNIPLTNNLLPPPVSAPKVPEAAQPVPSPTEAPKGSAEPPAEPPVAPAEQDKAENVPSSTSTPPTPPKTESPIPLNQFGLPPQVLPLGRIDPAYNGFTQLGPFTYPYPNFRFYDPYDPFSFNPYLNLPPPPLYRALPNFISQSPVPQGAPEVPSNENEIPSAPEADPQAPSSAEDPPAKVGNEAPPPEPDDLNVLNYASKDPSIPNVPPPPLPEGGLKSEPSE